MNGTIFCGVEGEQLNLFYLNFKSLNGFARNISISNFTKISPVGNEVFQAERRTDRYEEANNIILQFCEDD